MNRPRYIILHCSDSTFGTVALVDSWHKERGFGRIGYHYLIANGFDTYRKMKDGYRVETEDGKVYVGRAEGDVGAHCLGYNQQSIGVCLIGPPFTARQMASARELVTRLQSDYEIPTARVLGHCETEGGRKQGKTCPVFDCAAFRASLPAASARV